MGVSTHRVLSPLQMLTDIYGWLHNARTCARRRVTRTEVGARMSFSFESESEILIPLKPRMASNRVKSVNEIFFCEPVALLFFLFIPFHSPEVARHR